MLCSGIVNVISCVETIRTKVTTEQQAITRLQDLILDGSSIKVRDLKGAQEEWGVRLRTSYFGLVISERRHTKSQKWLWNCGGDERWDR